MTKRRAFTLIELVASMAGAAVLMAGLAGSLYISSRALRPEESVARRTAAADQVLSDVMADVRQAIAFTERTDRAITFRVPDRDGDALPDTIRYAWSGTPGDPLTYQFNGAAAVPIAEGVEDFELSALTRLMELSDNAAPVAAGVAYHSFEMNTSSSGMSIGIPRPEATAEGDLLIATVATDGKTTPTAPIGWTPIDIGTGPGFSSMATPTLAAWWKLAGGSESNQYQFNGLANKQAYGCIMLFTGNDPDAPVSTSTLHSGKSSLIESPISPTVTTAVDGTLILRMGAFDGHSINLGDPGLPGHEPIVMDRTSTSGGAVSAGAGYLKLNSAGSSGESNFQLTSLLGEEYVTITIAISPPLGDDE